MKGETIFRFFSVRPAAPSKLSRSEKILLDPYEPVGSKTDFFETLEDASAQKNPRPVALVAARDFIASKSFVDRVSALDPDLTDLVTWFHENRRKDVFEMLDSSDFRELTGNGGSKMPPEFAASYANLVDSIVAMAIAGRSDKRRSEELVLVIKLLFIAYGESPKPVEGETLGGFVSRLVVALPPFIRDLLIEAPTTTREPIPSGPKTDSAADYLRRLEQAHDEISEVLRHTDSISVTGNITRPGTSVLEEHLSPAQFAELTAVPKFNTTAIGELSTDTKNLVGTTLKLDLANLNPYLLMNRLAREIRSAGAAVQTDAGYGTVQVGGAWIDLGKFKAAYTRTNSGGTLSDNTVYGACTYSAGLADLLLIRQQLKGYRLGEIAHVENVLQGEKRERNHRRLTRTTDELFTEEEREVTRERDLETTERNELQNEISQTATTELGLDVGVQVSGSFGPSVSFDSQVDSSFSSTVEDSQRKATTFSKELSEKSSEKIRERVKKERRKTTVEEVEEINQHRFENTSGGNIRGIYRWMDKIYEAQVMNYGQRMMFDFVLPEPAAFFLYALLDSPPEAQNIPKPEAPKFINSPLAPQDLTIGNYQSFIRKYNVTGAPEPPPTHITVSYTDKQEGNSRADYARSAIIQIPDFYEAYKAAVVCDHVAPNDNNNVNITIGGRFIDARNAGWIVKPFAEPREKQLALGINCRNVVNFCAAIDVFCALTPEGLRSWQNKVYEAIMDAFRLQLAEYEEKLANASVQRGPTGTLGADPVSNQNVTREELRKLALMLLTNNAAPGLDSFQEGAEPVPDPEKACKNGAIIRFFENAFEWNNMAYVMYPYFWGRKARWTSAIQLTGTDSEFTTFLKAGAARMQLAVRPGFEKAVVHFIQFGNIWEGNDPPVAEDDLYMPIIQELKESLQKLEGNEDGVPYPEDSKPWEINLPTSLVYLQERVPEFEDPLEE